MKDFVENGYVGGCVLCGLKSENDYTFKGGSVLIEFGFGSKFDGEKHEFLVCDKCFTKIVSIIKHRFIN